MDNDLACVANGALFIYYLFIYFQHLQSLSSTAADRLMQFDHTDKISFGVNMCAETPLAYWSSVPINEDNFPHAHTCPKSARCGGPAVAAERIDFDSNR